MRYLKISRESGDILYVEIEGVRLDELITPDLEYMELGDKYILEIAEMIEEEYKALPEFDGDW